MKYDILLIGDYFADLVFSGLSRLPELGREAVGTGFDMVTGGTCNTAVAMHRLGLKVGWAADFGDDEFSRFALARMRAEGLDDTLFVRHQRPIRNITVSVSFPEDRAFITFCDPRPQVPAAIKALATASARAACIAGLYYGSFFAVGLAAIRLKRMKLIMDGNSSGEETLADRAVKRAVQSVDLFLPNALEARRMTAKDDLAAAIRALGKLCPLVVVKDGPRGAYACADGEIVHAPAISVTPVDTTGAGDCFNAGFIKAWLDGRPLVECLRWGNIVGGLSTLARGGTGRVVTVADVERYLAAG
jgi:sugar/nucleoside kinase (ribokinase family)